MVGMTRLWLGGVLAVGVSLAPLAARAQMDSREAIQLQNEILALRHDLDALQKGGGQGGSALGSAKHAAPAAANSDILTQLLDRVSLLEDQMRQLRGHVDELNNQMVQQNADLNKKIDDLGFRVDTFESGKHPATTPAAPAEAAAEKTIPPSTSPPPTSLGTLPVPPAAPPTGAKEGVKEGAAKPTAQSLLQDGRTAFARHDYASAEDSAEQALAIKGAHTVDARFLLGQSLAAEHQFQKAALAFDDTYKAAPTGPRAPEALLGLAESLAAINAKPAACATLAKFAKEFPAAHQGLRDRAQTLRQRAACG